MREFVAVSYLFSPLLLGLTVHGLCLKFGWLGFLSKPVDQNHTFRGRPVFGANKTYRGLAAVSLGTALGFGLQATLFHRFASIKNIEIIDYYLPNSLLLGWVLGLAAMLGELPNSFIKRQLRIAPGAAGAKGFLNGVFYVFDQVDFLIGAWLVLAVVVTVTFERVLASLIFIFVSHQILTSIGYWLGMRKTAR